MTWGSLSSFPRAILHIDGDSFFASCEVAKNPRLRGKPVITGRERGIVSACTYDLKALGIKTGMRVSEAKKIAPDAIVLPSDYESYSLFSERMYEIVRRYTPTVEEYSIDECFADITGLRRLHHKSYPEIAAAIKKDLQVELGITFSIGLSATKVLAKVGSKWQKPDGLTVIPLRDAGNFLGKISAGKLWGIGPNTANLLEQHGVKTALQFAQKDEAWVKRVVTKPIVEIWHEINGDAIYDIQTKPRESYQSIQKTKTFTPPSRDRDFIYSQLSKNVENACIKARRWNLASPHIFFFLKTNEFRFHGCEIKLTLATCVPQDILGVVSEHFDSVCKPGVLYRATGVTLMKLQDVGTGQLDLFGAAVQSQALKTVFESVDQISEKYGKHVVYLGSSFAAMRHGAHRGERGDAPERTRTLFKGETARRRLNIPMLGEVN
jgi:DNA polymerase IV